MECLKLPIKAMNEYPYSDPGMCGNGFMVFIGLCARGLIMSGIPVRLDFRLTDRKLKRVNKLIKRLILLWAYLFIAASGPVVYSQEA